MQCSLEAAVRYPGSPKADPDAMNQTTDHISESRSSARFRDHVAQSLGSMGSVTVVPVSKGTCTPICEGHLTFSLLRTDGNFLCNTTPHAIFSRGRTWVITCPGNGGNYTSWRCYFDGIFGVVWVTFSWKR